MVKAAGLRPAGWAVVIGWRWRWRWLPRRLPGRSLSREVLGQRTRSGDHPHRDD